MAVELEGTTYRLHDLSGRLLQEGIYGEKITLKSCQTGMLILIIKTKTGWKSSKLLVQ
jgi:hypothetical protein